MLVLGHGRQPGHDGSSPFGPGAVVAARGRLVLSGGQATTAPCSRAATDDGQAATAPGPSALGSSYQEARPRRFHATGQPRTTARPRRGRRGLAVALHPRDRMNLSHAAGSSYQEARPRRPQGLRPWGRRGRYDVMRRLRHRSGHANFPFPYPYDIY